jgi:hypothetical protein
MGCVASVEKVSVNVNDLEWEYVDGVNRDAVTVRVRGREIRVSKITVSLPCTASHGMACVDGVVMSERPLSASCKACSVSEAHT